MNHPIKLLALDLDGTVLNNAKHITPVTRAALEAAIAAGVTVIPASGRPMTGLCEEFLSIPGVEYALTSNGAAVYRLRDNQPIYTNYLDTDLAAELMAGMLELELMATFFADSQGYAVKQQMALLDRLPLDEPVKAYLRSSRKLLEDPVTFIRQQGKVEKFSLNFLHGPDGKWVDYDKLKVMLDRHPELSVVSGGTDNLEITSPTATKGTALLALAGLPGIPREQTMACGDSENDLEMLKAAGFSVAMANARTVSGPMRTPSPAPTRRTVWPRPFTSTFSLNAKTGGRAADAARPRLLSS